LLFAMILNATNTFVAEFRERCWIDHVMIAKIRLEARKSLPLICQLSAGPGRCAQRFIVLTARPTADRFPARSSCPRASARMACPLTHAKRLNQNLIAFTRS